jgi:DDE superfamily endonuclease
VDWLAGSLGTSRSNTIFRVSSTSAGASLAFSAPLANAIAIHLYQPIDSCVSKVGGHSLDQSLVGLLYVRAKDIEKIPRKHHWQFHTKLELAAGQVLKLAKLAHEFGKTAWVAADGVYAKRAFLKPLRQAGVVAVSRLRKDAALFDVPAPPKQRGRGRPRQYGTKRISLSRRAAHPAGWQTIECLAYGKLVSKTIKSFWATYRPAGGVIRVVIAAKRCKTNIPNFPQRTVAPQKLETFINGCYNWQLDNFDNSESAEISKANEKSPISTRSPIGLQLPGNDLRRFVECFDVVVVTPKPVANRS